MPLLRRVTMRDLRAMTAAKSRVTFSVTIP